MQTGCNVTLLHHTPLWIVAQAIRTCWQSQDKSDTTFQKFDSNGITTVQGTCGPNDLALIDRIGNKFKHKSTLRHVTYVFECKDVSTKTLLALTRHCMGKDISVESTRYTTKKRKDSLSITYTKNPSINAKLDKVMQLVKEAIEEGASNDDISMLLPQAYNYSFVMTMNIQSLQHFLELRLKPDAHWDIQALAANLLSAVPADHKYLFEHCLVESE